MPDERMGPCRAVRIWGLGRNRRNKPACRCAVCSLAVLSMRSAFAGRIESDYVTRKTSYSTAPGATRPLPMKTVWFTQEYWGAPVSMRSKVRKY
jgi:hypothetical protein